MEALWGLSNVACHSPFTAAEIVKDDILTTIVTGMGSRYFFVKKEAYFVVGNLFIMLTGEDLKNLVVEKYPHILKEYVRGLEYFINNERTLISIL